MPPETPYRIIEGSALQAVPANYADLGKPKIVNEDKLEEAVIAENLTSGTFITEQYGDGTVTTAKLADNAVTNVKVADNAIDTAELVANAVTQAKIATGSIDIDRLETTDILNSDVTLAASANTQVQLENPGATTTAHYYLISLTPNGGTSTNMVAYISVDCNNGDTKLYVENKSAISGGTVRARVRRIVN